jgi:putative two-component system response regulator
MMSMTEEHKKPTILIVDDTPDNIVLLSSLLRGLYTVKAATDGVTALEIAASGAPPDLILLDIVMLGMDGYEVCRRLKEGKETKDIPVIFLTARSEVEDERKGFELGAVDFISRPISPHILKARVSTHLKLKSVRDFFADRGAWLEKEVARRVRENRSLQDVAMVALGSLAETRDNETGSHIRRTQGYLSELADALRSRGSNGESFADGSMDLIVKSAPLHDIGKVGIPDHILLKPGKLEASEFEVMKRHTTMGRDALEKAEILSASDTSFLRFAREIAYSHHEKWDGSGYPLGLAGSAIPLSGRLMAIADVYDALISKRVYKPAMTHEEAVKVLVNGSGSHFDPALIEVFLPVANRFREISRVWLDTEAQ